MHPLEPGGVDADANNRCTGNDWASEMGWQDPSVVWATVKAWQFMLPAAEAGMDALQRIYIWNACVSFTVL